MGTLLLENVFPCSAVHLATLAPAQVCLVCVFNLDFQLESQSRTRSWLMLQCMSSTPCRGRGGGGHQTTKNIKTEAEPLHSGMQRPSLTFCVPPALAHRQHRPTLLPQLNTLTCVCHFCINFHPGSSFFCRRSVSLLYQGLLSRNHTRSALF